jgi:hypothetical protein
MEFGDAETITIADLRTDDFVLELPAQNGVRGAVVNSGIRELREDYSTWKVGRPRRRGIPVRSRVVAFKDRTLATLNVPATFTVTVRRPVAATAE